MIFLAEASTRKPRVVFWIAGLLSVAMLTLAALPTLWPQHFPALYALSIDTDPENMLPADEAVRVYHNTQKRDFSLHDMIVVGVVNTRHAQGVFNPRSLNAVYELANFAKSLQWQDDMGNTQGVIAVDLMAPSTVDNIVQAGPGTVSFEWLMAQPPTDDAGALAIAKKAQRLPMLNGTLVSEDGKAIALYLPLTAKNVSYKVAKALKEKISQLESGDQFYITGLPVAQDTFGIEMFKQIAISAPMAMLLIFLLMWYFFKSVIFILSPMIVALISVTITMGMLIATGHTVHIMSSMIPIFIMPIAVLDAIHILSDFFDRYPQTRDRYKTIKAVMEELSAPMLYTTLTTTVGFASLALTPLPPVQTFGIFVSMGVLVAWIFTITVIPAYIMCLSEDTLAKFSGSAAAHDAEEHGPLSQSLYQLGPWTFRNAKLILLGVFVLAGIAGLGISRIQINDNPVKWFSPDHNIRVADRALNERFAGTYMAYLVLQDAREQKPLADYAADLQQTLAAQSLRPLQQLAAHVPTMADMVADGPALLAMLTTAAEDGLNTAGDDWADWEGAVLYLESLRQQKDLFKDPAMLNYMSRLQDYLLTTGIVGKSSSLADIVKTVHRELYEGDQAAYRIPVSAAGVAQTLMTYQNSHRPQDLWHFVTPDYRKTTLWLQLKSGDNKDMSAVLAAVTDFMDANPAPVSIQKKWFGLTYINVIWQQKMVAGMLEAFAGSFAIVFIMMVLLFRSLLWGTLAMVPLTLTIGLIYGIIGLIGKNYDMPVAVLSSLSLGLAVDYAIHFLARARYLRPQFSSWADTIPAVFGEPARAISRNVIVVGVGFLPLLAAPLVPYKTVGVFISAILVIAGLATLIILPALMTLLEKKLFRAKAATDTAVQKG